MAKLFSITFDAKTEEIAEAYTAFQNRYTLRKKIIYTVVYLIVIVLGVDLIIKNYTSPAGYIATGLAAGILLFNWIKPLTVKKRLMQTLSELNDETYTMNFYDDKLTVETIIDKSAETETVAITSTGVYTVEEGSEAENIKRILVPAEGEPEIKEASRKYNAIANIIQNKSTSRRLRFMEQMSCLDLA